MLVCVCQFWQVMGADSGPGAPAAVPWRKVLYERQPFPDNYVDQRFLEELRRNIRVRQYRYWAVVRETGLIAQQVLRGRLPHIMVLYGAGRPGAARGALGLSRLCLLGYGLYEILGGSCVRERTRLADLQSATIFLALPLGFHLF